MRMLANICSAASRPQARKLRFKPLQAAAPAYSTTLPEADMSNAHAMSICSSPPPGQACKPRRFKSVQSQRIRKAAHEQIRMPANICLVSGKRAAGRSGLRSSAVRLTAFALRPSSALPSGLLKRSAKPVSGIASARQGLGHALSAAWRILGRALARQQPSLDDPADPAARSALGH